MGTKKANERRPPVVPPLMIAAPRSTGSLAFDRVVSEARVFRMPPRVARWREEDRGDLAQGMVMKLPQEHAFTASSRALE
jgi:hypothetical protein